MTKLKVLIVWRILCSSWTCLTCQHWGWWLGCFGWIAAQSVHYYNYEGFLHLPPVAASFECLPPPTIYHPCAAKGTMCIGPPMYGGAVAVKPAQNCCHHQDTRHSRNPANTNTWVMSWSQGNRQTWGVSPPQGVCCLECIWVCTRSTRHTQGLASVQGTQHATCLRSHTCWDPALTELRRRVRESEATQTSLLRIQETALLWAVDSTHPVRFQHMRADKIHSCNASHYKLEICKKWLMIYTHW